MDVGLKVWHSSAAFRRRSKKCSNEFCSEPAKVRLVGLTRLNKCDGVHRKGERLTDEVWMFVSRFGTHQQLSAEDPPEAPRRGSWGKPEIARASVSAIGPQPRSRFGPLDMTLLAALRGEPR